MANQQTYGQHPNSTPQGLRESLSFMIITKNEEANIAACIKSLPAECSVLVIDSGSEDETVAICTKLGAQVKTREFDDYSNQKNFGLSFIKTPFVFCLDADEVMSTKLQTILPTLLNPDCAYKVQRRLVFQGRTMKFGKTTDYPIRLFPVKNAQFRGKVHEVIDLPDTCVKVASEYLLHYSYRDLTDYFERFNRYTSLVADQHLEKARSVPGVGVRKVRPFLEFLVRYFFRLGFLDGHPGFVYALISSLYVSIKYEKLAEKHRRKVEEDQC